MHPNGLGYIILVLIIMEHKKYFRGKPQSNRKDCSNYQKYRPLSKMHNQFKSQCCSKHNITIKNQSNKINNACNNSTQKCNSKKKISRTSVLRKIIFPDPPQLKIKTENSSLSCSTFKNRGNHSSSKDNFKHRSHIESVQGKIRGMRQKMQIKRPSTALSSGKKTVNLNSTIRTSSTQLQKIMVRTKDVLESWQRERESWQKQRLQYEWKINELYGQIDLLREKVSLGAVKDNRFHNIFIY